MGAVFVGRDTRLGRKVAIKFLLVESEELREQFLFEAQVTARFQHENIVVIHEIGIHREVPYMVLEHLEGEALSAELKRGSLSWRRAVELMIPVTKALVSAHQAGIVHRDLKPANIFLCRSGVVKVLDFGIAKENPQGPSTFEPAREVEDSEYPGGVNEAARALHQTLSAGGRLVGTLPFMSPEQWEAKGVDEKTDLFAMGILLYRLVTGGHPVGKVSQATLAAALSNPELPFPSIATQAPDLPAPLIELIDRLIEKKKDQRLQTALELQDRLLALLPNATAATRGAERERCPFPGLAAFQENDAYRFYGRDRELARLERFLVDHSLVAVAGPSGAGKSSLIRAGLLPRLREEKEQLEVLTLRPGATPMLALTRAIERIASSTLCDPPTLFQSLLKEREMSALPPASGELVQLLQDNPGQAGVLLRAHAERSQNEIVIFVDQFEEIFTLCHDAGERAAFFDCLLGAADDLSSPIRIVICLRADYLDRIATHTRFMNQVSSGLFFLGPLETQALEAALIQPLLAIGYHFEDPGIVQTMVEEARQTLGSLPLMQFAALQLWEARDTNTHTLTKEAYQKMGGFGGALAQHADAVVTALPPAERLLVKSIFLRLCTPEGTRAVVELNALRGLTAESDKGPTQEDPIDGLIQRLVDGRLVTLEGGSADEAKVELVHEALISAWPALQHWRDQGQEHTAFLSELQSASKRWIQKGREPGLLWTGDAAVEATRFQEHYSGNLADQERLFLNAVIALSLRGRRLRRAWLVVAFTVLSGLVLGGSFSMIRIKEANAAAKKQATLALQEAARARQAEAQVNDQLAVIKEKERARRAATEEAQVAASDLKMSRGELEKSYGKLELALAKARAAVRNAEAARAAEASARERLQTLLKQEQKRVKALERERKKIATELR